MEQNGGRSMSPYPGASARRRRLGVQQQSAASRTGIATAATRSREARLSPRKPLTSRKHSGEGQPAAAMSGVTPWDVLPRARAGLARSAPAGEPDDADRLDPDPKAFSCSWAAQETGCLRARTMGGGRQSPGIRVNAASVVKGTIR